MTSHLQRKNEMKMKFLYDLIFFCMSSASSLCSSIIPKKNREEMCKKDENLG